MLESSLQGGWVGYRWSGRVQVVGWGTSGRVGHKWWVREFFCVFVLSCFYVIGYFCLLLHFG